MTKESSLNDLLLRTEIDVLAFLLNRNDRAVKLEIVMDLEPQNFSDPINARIYQELVPILVRHGDCDLVQVGHALKNEKGNYLIRLGDMPLRDYAPEVKAKAEELRQRTILRRITEFSTALSSKVGELGAGESLKMLEDFVFDEYKQKNENIDLHSAFDKILEGRKGGVFQGFNWIESLPKLREVTGGIERGKTYIIGATKKSGKTRFAVRIMKTLCDQLQKPLFLSMEMREVEVVKLFLSAFTGLSTSIFKKEFAHVDEQQLRAGLEKFEDVLNLDTEGFLTIEKIRAKVWRASSQGCSVCVIDYLQRMQYPESKVKNYATIVAETVARLADIGRDYNVAMIILSQLRNEAEKQAVADMSFLKDSGGIAENADCIITLTNKQRQAEGEGKYSNPYDGIEFFISVEQRDGESTLIKTKAQLGTLSFEEAL